MKPRLALFFSVMLVVAGLVPLLYFVAILASQLALSIQAGKWVPLPMTLLALAQNAGRVLSRDALMTLLKNEQLEAFDRSIDVHISRIRAAIEDDPKKPKRVITVRGTGYVFAKNQD